MSEYELVLPPGEIRRWATGPVDGVADDLKAAATTMTTGCQDRALPGADAGTKVGAALLAVIGEQGNWGRDERYIRGRLYEFAEGLIACARDLQRGDDANAGDLKRVFGTQYQLGDEPDQLGDSLLYLDWSD